ncbi:unnamed protein product [Brachionus calyciflorus]|uniref:Uncharacterized protein n=1 Tax=Brachionus calyciflorus TaxID=104777 RepID=A0A813NXD5_9BILA|nr:unnamed protein product [Brachionus calyciflorus]
MSDPLSTESILENPSNQTLDDVNQDWSDVLKPKKGASKKNLKSLQHQPSDLVSDEEEKGIEEETIFIF